MHDHLETQRAVIAVLQKLSADQKLILQTEGTWTTLDFSDYQHFSQKSLQEVSESFLKMGKIEASQYAALNFYKNVKVKGIENRELYFKNIAFLKKGLNQQTQFLTENKKILNTVRLQILKSAKPEFKNYFLTRESFLIKTISLKMRQVALDGGRGGNHYHFFYPPQALQVPAPAINLLQPIKKKTLLIKHNKSLPHTLILY